MSVFASIAPQGWRRSRIKHISSLKGRLGWQGLKAAEYMDDGPYVVSSAHFRNYRIEWERCPHVTKERYDLDANIQLNVGDILLMKDGAALGKLAFVDLLPGPACLNSHLLLFRPVNHAYWPKFLFYVLTTQVFQDYILVHGTGATFLGVSQEAVGDCVVALPSYEYQRAIADFLDRKTAAIDALIEKKQRLIELLQEKRQALITQAVTKGLDPNVPMKDSGIEWLGKIPHHWEVVPFRRCLVTVEQGWSPLAEDREATEGELGVLKLSAIAGGRFWWREHKAFDGVVPVSAKRLQIRKGDLLITRANTVDLVAEAAVVDENPPVTLLMSDLVYRVSLKPDRAVATWMVFALRSSSGRHQIQRDARGSSMTMAKVSQGHIKEWLIPLPPVHEQEQICSWLNDRLACISRAEETIAKQLDRLREYRQALITAAVTGKLPIPAEPAA